MSWATPVAALGGMLGSALIGTKKSSEEKALTAAQTEAIKQQMELAKIQEQRSGEQYGMASPIYKNLISYYQKQAESPYAAIAPNIEATVRDTYNLENQIRRDLPRGGGMEMALAQNRLSLGGLPTTMAQQYRNQAYATLAGLGSDLMGGAGTGAAQAATTYNSLLGMRPQQSSLAPAMAQMGNTSMQALLQWLQNRQKQPQIPSTRVTL